MGCAEFRLGLPPKKPRLLMAPCYYCCQFGNWGFWPNTIGPRFGWGSPSITTTSSLAGKVYGNSPFKDVGRDDYECPEPPNNVPLETTRLRGTLSRLKIRALTRMRDLFAYVKEQFWKLRGNLETKSKQLYQTITSSSIDPFIMIYNSDYYTWSWPKLIRLLGTSWSLLEKWLHLN